ncbi:aminopeptidase P family protein [Candidatus Bipolaricaulota bacterium]|nr:aminopeptidase P family protein [Candidatus Bipolaricaulota bacterium]
MVDYGRRWESLIQGIDAEMFIAVNYEGTDKVSLRYLTGFTGEGALLVAEPGAILLTDSRYVEQAQRETAGTGVEVRELASWLNSGLAETIGAAGVARVAFASARVTHRWVEQVEAQIKATLVSLPDPLSALRVEKQPDELAFLRRAAEITDRALDRLVPEIHVGMTEIDIALRLDLLIREAGAESVAFECNVSAGENTALNHYNPALDPRPLQRGDLLLFDIGSCYRGYRSDMTRTFCVEEADDRAREIYDLVLQANLAGIAAVRSGASGIEVDKVARDVIVGAGHGDHFGHGLGHGIGMEIHEAPRLSQKSKDTLAPGMVVTVEPGIYLPGYGGVRIEDDVVVTNDGCEIITGFPKRELLVVG